MSDNQSNELSTGQDTFYYDNTIVRNFLIATTIFGIIGMSVGLLVAFQFVWPEANFGLQYTTFGRVRPLHTNAVIFAFVGNGIFAGVYTTRYSVYVRLECSVTYSARYISGVGKSSF